MHHLVLMKTTDKISQVLFNVVIKS